MKKLHVAILCFALFFLGWVAGNFFQLRNVNAARPQQYKVAELDARGYAGLEAILNREANQGWKFHSFIPGQYQLIFER